MPKKYNEIVERFNLGSITEEDLGSKDEFLRVAMERFVEDKKDMNAQFDQGTIIFHDLSQGKRKNPYPYLFPVQKEGGKLMPRKGRFSLQDGQIEFSYDNLELDVLRGQKDGYGGGDYITWYENEKLAHFLQMISYQMDSFVDDFEANLIRRLVGEGAIPRSLVLKTSRLNVEYKVYASTAALYSADVHFDILAELASDRNNSLYYYPEMVPVLDEYKPSLAPVLSVMNSALTYFTQALKVLSTNMIHDFNIIEAGLKGEEKVLQAIQKAPHFVLKSGYTLQTKNDSFESDLILVNEQGIHLIEVKNYASMSSQKQSFEIHADGSMDYYVNGKLAEKRRSPVEQVLRQKALLETVLAEHAIDFPVHAYVVLANEEIPYQNDSDVPVLYWTEISTAVQKAQPVLDLVEAEKIERVIEAHKRSEKKFPVFDYLKVSREIYEDILDETASFIRDEMYADFDPESFITIALFGNYVLSSVYPQLSEEEKKRLFMRADHQIYLEVIEERTARWGLLEKLGFIFFPSLVSLINDSKKRLFGGLGYLLSSLAFILYFLFKEISNFATVDFSILTEFVFITLYYWQWILAFFFAYWKLSQKEVQEFILGLSQGNYQFLTSSYAEKLAKIFSIHSYREDDHGNYSEAMTLRYHKLMILFVFFILLAILLRSFFMINNFTRLIFIVWILMLDMKLIKESLV